MHPTIRASKQEGTKVGLSRVPALFLITFMLKGSSLPACMAISSFLSMPVACSRGSGITGGKFCYVNSCFWIESLIVASWNVKEKKSNFYERRLNKKLSHEQNSIQYQNKWGMLAFSFCNYDADSIEKVVQF